MHIPDCRAMTMALPKASMARLGGDAHSPHPRGYQQLAVMAYQRGADDKPHTSDDVELGPIDVNWSVEEFYTSFGDDDKEYVGTLTLGATTTTQDRQGEVIETKPVPELHENEIRAAFDKFRGDFYQMPPMVSAKKHGGVPLYKLARQGKVVERDPRFVHVYRYTIDRIALPDIDFSVLCSKGFYVRTYAHDIGTELGCGAHLKALRRTKSGRFNVEDAITIEEIKNSPREQVTSRILSLPQVSRMRGA